MSSEKLERKDRRQIKEGAGHWQTTSEIVLRPNSSIVIQPSDLIMPGKDEALDQEKMNESR